MSEEKTEPNNDNNKWVIRAREVEGSKQVIDLSIRTRKGDIKEVRIRPMRVLIEAA